AADRRLQRFTHPAGVHGSSTDEFYPRVRLPAAALQHPGSNRAGGVCADLRHRRAAQLHPDAGHVGAQSPVRDTVATLPTAPLDWLERGTKPGCFTLRFQVMFPPEFL